jgi:hypothetical protein
VIDRVGSESDPQQLPACHQPVLARGQRVDLLLDRVKSAHIAA